MVESVEYATPYAREPEEKVPLGTTTTTTIANPNPYSKCVKLNVTIIHYSDVIFHFVLN